MINLPLWIPLLGFAGLGMLILRTLAREPNPGCCSRCGYNLQGIGSKKRCPECGDSLTKLILGFALARVCRQQQTHGKHLQHLRSA